MPPPPSRRAGRAAWLHARFEAKKCVTCFFCSAPHNLSAHYNLSAARSQLLLLVLRRASAPVVLLRAPPVLCIVVPATPGGGWLAVAAPCDYKAFAPTARVPGCGVRRRRARPPLPRLVCCLARSKVLLSLACSCSPGREREAERRHASSSSRPPFGLLRALRTPPSEPQTSSGWPRACSRPPPQPPPRPQGPRTSPHRPARHSPRRPPPPSTSAAAPRRRRRAARPRPGCSRASPGSESAAGEGERQTRTEDVRGR